MDNTKPVSSQEDFVTKRSRWGAIILSGLVLLVCAYFLVNTFQQPKTTIIYITLAVLIVTAIMSLTGLILAVLKRQEQGLKSTLYALFILGITIVALVTGRTLAASFSILTVSVLAIEWLLPAQTRKQHLILTAVVFAGMWIIEFINLPWRIDIGTATVGPFVAIVFAIFLAFMAFQRWRNAISTSLRIQITVWTGAIIATLAIFLLTYSVIASRQAAFDAAEREALAVSGSNARLIHDQLNTPLVTARALADSLEGIKDPNNPLRLSRAEVNAMLKKIAEENPSFLATYTLWEPNAFDGFDSLYAGKPGYDETGRFIPYWVRRPDGTVTVEPLVGYETPGLGDWYIIPRQTRQEYTVAPLIYPIAGVDTLMASFIVPVMVEGKFYGITGVDAPIAFVQSIVDNVNLYNDQAEAVLLTDTGTLIAVHKSPEFTNQPADLLFSDFAELQPRITNGEAFISLSPDGQFLRVFSPVDIGDVGTHWSFSLIIPFSAITAQATNSALLEAAIGLTLIALALFVLWYLTGQIVQPILNLTTIAEAVSQGNLNAIAEVQSKNETGTLANAFNIMTTQLRETVAGLEQRITDRTRNLELAAKVGRTVSQVRELDVMLTNAAELIRQQFDLYYVQVYLVNPSKTYLTLEAGTGSVGKELLERNHRLPFNTTSLNGRAGVDKKPVVIANTLKSALFKPNPLLPDTRSEMAVPLLIGDKVVGVLDMQSNQSDALNESILPAFEALAGQLAIAIQNANFLAETQQARTEVETQARRLVRSNWENYMDAIHEPEHTGFVFEQNKIETLSHLEEMEPAGENTHTAAITVTGETVGNLVVEMDEQTSSTHNDQLVEAVARQVAQQIESLRLIESAERFRFEAEAASRRLTREGWQEYLAAKQGNSLGFMYDLKEVKPIGTENNLHDAAVILPIKVGEEQVGRFSIQGIQTDEKNNLDLASAVIDRLGKHIESLRLLEKTEESRAEIQLSQERLSEALEIARLGNWEYDVEKDIFTFNDNFYLVFHTNVKEVGSYYLSSGEYTARFVHPEDAPMVGGEIGKALNSTDRRYSTALEHRVILADGTIGYISVNVNVERDEQGKITRFYGANQNITERKEIEESLRARETQLSTALTQTEKLSNAGIRFTQAADLQELVSVAVEMLEIHPINRAILGTFNYAPDNSLESMDILANWWNGTGHEATQVGTQYPIEALQIMTFFLSTTPVFMNNALEDERVDSATLNLLKQRNIRSIAALPLYLGTRQIGTLLLESEEVHEFTQSEMVLLTAMAPQIATVLDNRRQFMIAQQQAQRETTLNVISQKIQSATTVEAVLQIAARELGHALGAPMTIAQLSMKDSSS